MKKHHFDAFQHEKHFEKQSQPHSQTGPKLSHLYDPGHEILLAYTVCWFFWIFLISFFLHWICCVLGFIFFFFCFLLVSWSHVLGCRFDMRARFDFTPFFSILFFCIKLARNWAFSPFFFWLALFFFRFSWKLLFFFF
jgi:hypothetical protein